MDNSAAALRVASRSSGRIISKEVVAALVRIPECQRSPIFLGQMHTHGLDDLCVGEVIDDNLAHLGEMPSVPFLDPHRVNVDLLVKIV
jgi:hypothetical protein